MSIINFADYLNSLISAGSSVEGNVVKVIADNGTEVGDAVFKVIQGGNGTAQEVGVAVSAGAGGATATGLAFMAVDVGVMGAAIAPALGVLAGVGLYNLAPEFWTTVSNALVDAGQTIGGKVIAYWNGDNVYFDEQTVEIFKNALLQYNYFATPPDVVLPTSDQPSGTFTLPFDLADSAYINVNPYPTYTPLNGAKMLFYGNADRTRCYILAASENSGEVLLVSYNGTPSTPYTTTHEYSFEGKKVYYINVGYIDLSNTESIPNPQIQPDNPTYAALAWLSVYGDIEEGVNPNVQPDATYPSSQPFPSTYPSWLPWEYPQTVPDPSELPTVYPAKYPGVGPEGYPEQDPAQNPEPESVPDIYPEILPDFDIPTPGVTPEPTPTPDPDPQPDPEPIPEPDPVNPAPDPTDPNPDPSPSPAVPVAPLPTTVSSNKLFTVYNPTGAQLDSLGAYLWDGSIIAAIRDIWQEPLDGVISLQQVYVTPPTSGSHNIILGFLDSGVSSLVVSDQFVTVDCGSVTIPENKENATDYAPYTSLHLYLPFIGIVELDTNECMNSSINVKYKVDVYTGTCLATVSVTRSIDMPNSPILYTYSGNCSQQLPLTSGNATGMLSALIGGITAGLSVASGGGLGVLAGAQIAGQSLTHEMFHVSHSGNISSNAGIMGNKKPYLIIGRRHCYDANNYNALYGYPANKTVVLGNHTGYVKVKKCFLKTAATAPEHDQIMALLSSGVIL